MPFFTQLLQASKASYLEPYFLNQLALTYLGNKIKSKVEINFMNLLYVQVYIILSILYDLKRSKKLNKYKKLTKLGEEWVKLSQ